MELPHNYCVSSLYLHPFRIINTSLPLHFEKIKDQATCCLTRRYLFDFFNLFYHILTWAAKFGGPFNEFDVVPKNLIVPVSATLTLVKKSSLVCRNPAPVENLLPAYPKKMFLPDSKQHNLNLLNSINWPGLNHSLHGFEIVFSIPATVND